MTKATSIVLGTVAVSALSYVLYFDYQRRHSPEFRRNLRKSQRKYQKELDSAKENERQKSVELILAAVDKDLKENPLPTISSGEEFEAIFSQELMKVDTYLRLGEQAYPELVVSIFRLLGLHPQPAQIYAAIKSTVPEVISGLNFDVLLFLTMSLGGSCCCRPSLEE
ncbi:hypothetical protein V1514DRAFT_328617 [Lipomyces japonicus]|uniref:uncharacterized protein n=1 Tax=Lipomyces japonicus TaxID=56871 RepID=UPI0034CDBA4A